MMTPTRTLLGLAFATCVLAFPHDRYTPRIVPEEEHFATMQDIPALKGQTLLESATQPFSQTKSRLVDNKNKRVQHQRAKIKHGNLLNEEACTQCKTSSQELLKLEDLLLSKENEIAAWISKAYADTNIVAGKTVALANAQAAFDQFQNTLSIDKAKYDDAVAAAHSKDTIAVNVDKVAEEACKTPSQGLVKSVFLLQQRGKSVTKLDPDGECMQCITDSKAAMKRHEEAETAHTDAIKIGEGIVAKQANHTQLLSNIDTCKDNLNVATQTKLTTDKILLKAKAEETSIKAKKAAAKSRAEADCQAFENLKTVAPGMFTAAQKSFVQAHGGECVPNKLLNLEPRLKKLSESGSCKQRVADDTECNQNMYMTHGTGCRCFTDKTLTQPSEACESFKPKQTEKGAKDWIFYLDSYYYNKPGYVNMQNVVQNGK